MGVPQSRLEPTPAVQFDSDYRLISAGSLVYRDEPKWNRQPSRCDQYVRYSTFVDCHGFPYLSGL